MTGWCSILQMGSAWYSTIRVNLAGYGWWPIFSRYWEGWDPSRWTRVSMLSSSMRNLHTHQRLLKPLLLDQAFIAGLGNIYTDEALHLAGLHPTRHADELDEIQAQKLLQAIRQVLEEGIRRNGASFDWVYRGGSFQNSFRVYQRTGKPCPVCGTPVERLVIGQRGTHFCPACQPRAEDSAYNMKHRR